MGDAPAIDRFQIAVALPAVGCERPSIGPRRGESKIVNEPGGIACHDDADVAGVKIPLPQLLLCEIDVDVVSHTVPALEAAEGRHHQDIRALQPDLRGQRDIRCVYRF